MDYQSTIQALSPDLVARLRSAVELGRWPDGRPLSDAHRADCLDAIIQWEARHLPPEQRTGFIDRGRKRAGERCDEPQVLNLPDPAPGAGH